MVDLMNEVINGAVYPGAMILALILLAGGAYAIAKIIQKVGQHNW